MRTDRLSHCGHVFLCAGLLSAASFTGCGSGKDVKPTGKVSGKVTVQGQPVVKGTVTFEMKTGGTAMSSQLDPTGSFAIADPVPVGNYTVSVTPPEPSPDDAATPGGGVATKANIPQKYRNTSTSDLTMDVKAGDNPPQTFDLKP